MKKGLLIFFSILLLIVGGLIYLADRFTGDMTLTEEVQLEVAEGSSTGEIAALLADQGLVANDRVFKLFARKEKVDSQFKAGRYSFAAGSWSMEQVCDQLVAGGSSGEAVKVTIREGLTVGETAAVLEEAGLGSVAAYMEYASTGDFSAYDFIPDAADVIEPGNRLDGFLFPDTYMIDPSWTEQEIFDMLLEQFVYVWNSNDFDQAAAALDINIYQAVTMAALVEKEAKVAEDRPLIAGVFYNRLRENWKLESCATVQFIIGEPKVPLLFSDLETTNLYNSYMYEGLPPGPIAAPGLASLQAALHPEETTYMFFQARTDGSHRFSETLEEHQTHHEGDQ